MFGGYAGPARPRSRGPTLPAVEACARCGDAPGEGRFCATCAADQRPDEPLLPTAESIEAGRREEAWLAANPEVGRQVHEARRRAFEEDDGAARERRALADAERGLAGPDGPTRQFSDYRDLRVRAFAARAMLVTALGVTALVALFEAMHIGVLSDRRVSASAFITSADRLDIAYKLLFGATALCAIAFVAWLYKARVNTEALGVGHHLYGAGWAIGGWIVPIVWFWRPKQVVDEVWRASDPQPPPERSRTAWLRGRVPSFVHWWWGLWLASFLLDRIARGLLYDRGRSLDAQKDAMIFALASSIVILAAGILAIRLVSQVTQRQRRRAAQLEAAPPLRVRAEPELAGR
jgi:hypothetical protein